MTESADQPREPQARQLPSFKAPPITEVVCGVQFEPLEDLSAPHLGLLWQSLQPNFPRYREMPPLGSVIETFPPANRPSKLRLSATPIMPRMWFMSEDESQIVQIQKDRFLTNWKKVSEEQPYPRYGVVSGFFTDQFKAFTAFAAHANLPDIKPVQYELTYVNHIEEGVGWSNEKIGQLLPDISWRDGPRFLPPPEILNWNVSFPLPDEIGRLHVAAVNAVVEEGEKRTPIIQLTLTVRGIDKSNPSGNMSIWFDNSREWIVRAFADLTSSTMQTDVWRRLK